MNDALRMGKKTFTVFVAAATILWTVGIAAFIAPLTASAASYAAGDLIKGETLSTVYYYGSDGQRYSFPNEKTYFSWYEDFDGVVEISDAELADITLAGNIVYRPGTRWIKIESDAKTYAVSTNGTIRWIETEEVAVDLAGSTWNTFIDDVPDVFFVDYTVGSSLDDASEGYNGMLLTGDDGTYLVWDSEARLVSSAGMTANGFNSSYVLSGAGVDLDGMTAGDEITSERANMVDAAQLTTVEEVVTTTEVSVSLASDSPAASTLIAGQGVADLAHLTFNNPTSTALTVTGVTLTRTGVSSDTTLSSVYLFDGYVRLTDSATVSSGAINFNDSSGLFTIPANSSANIAVRSNIAASTSGQTVGITVASASAITFSGSYVADGSFPIAGSTHTIASSPSNYATLDFNTSTTPSAATIDPQDDYRVWENTVTVGNNEIDLYALRFRNIGSINADDIENYRLYIAGVSYGDAVANEDDNGYIVFDLSDDPVQLNTGNHTIKVLADIVGGTTRTVQVRLGNTADAVVFDQDYGQGVLATAASSTFSARTAGAQTINSGSLTVTKMTTSPSGNVTNGSSSVSLATYELKAYGEDIKVESLNFNIADDDNDTSLALRNSVIYADGVQVGSTSAICGDYATQTTCTSYGGSGASYSTFSFGSSLVVSPGDPVTLEVKADIYDNAGTNGIADADTLQVVIDATALSNNAYRQTTGSYFTAPSSDTAANSLTVAQGALTLAENTSYADQVTVAPKTAYKLASFSVTAGTTEDVRVTEWDVDFTAGGDAADASDDLSNLYITYGSASAPTTSSVKSTVADSDNTWSVDYTITKGTTIYVNVYSNVASSITDGAGTTDTMTPLLTITGQGAVSAQTASAAQTGGQTITFSTGTFTTAHDSSTAKIVQGNQEIEAAKFRFTTTNETYTITEVKFSVGSAAISSAISEARLYDGDDLVGTGVYALSSNTITHMTGLDIDVPANTYKILTLKYLLNDIGTGAGASQSNVKPTMTYVKYEDTNGTSDTDSTSRAANNIHVYKAIPTVTAVNLTNTTLVNNSAIDLYKFTVSASSNGSIALKQFKINTAWSDGGTTDTLEVESLKFYRDGVQYVNSTEVTMVDEDGNSVLSTSGLLEDEGTLIITLVDTEATISAGGSATFTVKGTPTGFRVNGATDTAEDSVTFYLLGDTTHNGTSMYLNDETDIAAGQSEILELFTSAAANTSDGTAANFIWSDMSSSSHAYDINASSSGDWANGYLVLNLDLDSESWGR